VVRRQAELLVSRGDVAALSDDDLMMISAEAIPAPPAGSSAKSTTRPNLGYA
jgi:hypothetical protein